MINDQWGLQRDPAMAAVAAKYQAPTIVMHNQQGTVYADLMQDVTGFLHESLRIAAAAGLPPALIIVDPGVGFGKTAEQNLDVIRDLGKLRVLGRPILLGQAARAPSGRCWAASPHTTGWREPPPLSASASTVARISCGCMT